MNRQVGHPLPDVPLALLLTVLADSSAADLSEDTVDQSAAVGVGGQPIQSKGNNKVVPSSSGPNAPDTILCAVPVGEGQQDCDASGLQWLVLEELDLQPAQGRTTPHTRWQELSHPKEGNQRDNP